MFQFTTKSFKNEMSTFLDTTVILKTKCTNISEEILYIARCTLFCKYL